MNILANLRKNQKVSDAIAVLPDGGVLYDDSVISRRQVERLKLTVRRPFGVPDYIKDYQYYASGDGYVPMDVVAKRQPPTAKNCINCAAPVKLQRQDCDHCGTIY